MRRAALLLAGLLLAVAAATPARALELSGKFIAGGLVIGRTQPGATVRLDGKTVPVATDGEFLLGFPREPAKTAELTVVRPDGTRERKQLRIESRTYHIDRINGLPPRKVTPSAKDLKRIRHEKAIGDAAKEKADQTRLALFDSGFDWPADGRVSGVYGSQRILNGKPRRPHYGTDLAIGDGTPVRAMADGIVRLAYPHMFFNGTAVMLDHGLGLISYYIHLSKLEVTVGERVKKGQVIGLSGASGRATGPHLHWAVFLRGTPLDPALLVPARP